MHVALRRRRQRACAQPDPARPVALLHSPRTFFRSVGVQVELTRRRKITLPPRDLFRYVGNDFAAGIAPLPPPARATLFYGQKYCDL